MNQPKNKEMYFLKNMYVQFAYQLLMKLMKGDLLILLDRQKTELLLPNDDVTTRVTRFLYQNKTVSELLVVDDQECTEV